MCMQNTHSTYYHVRYRVGHSCFERRRQCVTSITFSTATRRVRRVRVCVCVMESEGRSSSADAVRVDTSHTDDLVMRLDAYATGATLVELENKSDIQESQKRAATRDDGYVYLDGDIDNILPDTVPFDSAYYEVRQREMSILERSAMYRFYTMVAGLQDRPVESIFTQTSIEMANRFEAEMREWRKKERKRVLVTVEEKLKQRGEVVTIIDGITDRLAQVSVISSARDTNNTFVNELSRSIDKVKGEQKFIVWQLISTTFKQILGYPAVMPTMSTTRISSTKNSHPKTSRELSDKYGNSDKEDKNNGVFPHSVPDAFLIDVITHAVRLLFIYTYIIKPPNHVTASIKKMAEASRKTTKTDGKPDTIQWYFVNDENAFKGVVDFVLHATRIELATCTYMHSWMRNYARHGKLRKQVLVNAGDTEDFMNDFVDNFALAFVKVADEGSVYRLDHILFNIDETVTKLSGGEQASIADHHGVMRTLYFETAATRRRPEFSGVLTLTPLVVSSLAQAVSFVQHNVPTFATATVETMTNVDANPLFATDFAALVTAYCHNTVLNFPQQYYKNEQFNREIAAMQRSMHSMFRYRHVVPPLSDGASTPYIETLPALRPRAARTPHGRYY